MKLVCLQSHLSTNLSLVSRAVPSRPTHPILANVLLIADAQTQQVSLTGFDLSLGIRTSFTAEVETGGEITLPAKLLNDIVSRLPEGEITLEAVASPPSHGGMHLRSEMPAIAEASSPISADAVATLSSPQEGEAPFATITSASGRYQIRSMGVEEFPDLPTVEEGEAVYLLASSLIEGLRSTLFATSADETKQILTGLHLTVQEEAIEFAATDGHRLAVVCATNEIANTEESKNLEVTLPAKALRELERMLAIHDSSALQVALHFDQGQVVFEWADQTPDASSQGTRLPHYLRLTSRTLEGQYPAYRQLIPRSFSQQISIERRMLLSALERIAVIADQKNNIVKFSIDSINQELALSVEAGDIGSGKELMPLSQIRGESIEIAFNIKYLMDGLKALPSQEIQMQFNTATSPVIITPLGSLKMTYLIMPVQIRV